MFTGLIEAVGHVAEVRPMAAGFQLRCATALAAELAPGDSLAVDGVCLTVVTVDAEAILADVSPETARVTSLGALTAGSLVNLERPLRADARLGGHFVQGHVDATARVARIRPDGDSYWLTVAFPPHLAPYIVRKGSIAISGISLTVASLAEDRLDVQIVPFTWRKTNLCALKEGDQVNVECDILGKYVARTIESRAADAERGTTNARRGGSTTND